MPPSGSARPVVLYPCPPKGNVVRTAVDSSALLAVFLGEPDADAWVELLVAARQDADLVICETVMAEISPLFSSLDRLLDVLRDLGIRLEPTTADTAYLAGRIFSRYRAEGGLRPHLIPDFLIAAHAVTQAGQLAAADRGYLRRYFPELVVLRPQSRRS